ncbi:hypothetical protein J6590_014087 [Homalodisca vitripennis]|nr:hypothetical protein J6590_014087 [Homalodisca vitripennis]
MSRRPDRFSLHVKRPQPFLEVDADAGVKMRYSASHQIEDDDGGLALTVKQQQVRTMTRTMRSALSSLSPLQRPAATALLLPKLILVRKTRQSLHPLHGRSTSSPVSSVLPFSTVYFHVEE